MILALGLAIVLFGVLDQFLYSGVMLWGKSDRVWEKQHQLQRINEMLNRELTSLYVSGNLPEPTVQGDEEQLTFWNDTDSGLTLVHWHYDEAEHKLFKSSGFWGSSPEEKLFSEQITAWKFEYYQPETQNWLLSWEPQKKDDIPALIRVSVTSKAGDLGTITVPVKLYHPEVKDDATNS
jgi:hypothetical protein